MKLFFLIDEGQIQEVEDPGFVEYSPMAPLGQFSLKLGLFLNPGSAASYSSRRSTITRCESAAG